tara:strand:- start:298 stop:756 length:459 start_codon:yes stop_codon:yes gene_type:complete
MTPSKLNPKTQRKIYQAIRAGNYRSVACQFAGICENTLRNWEKKGRLAEKEDRKDIYYHFLVGLREAEAEAEVRNVAIVQKAAEKQWQASAWMLERRHPGRWARNDKQRIEMKAEVDVDDRSSKSKLEGILAGISERIREEESDAGDDGSGS